MIHQEKIRFLFDNALFYKDTTQWLRRRTFEYLYFGLLIIAELITLFIGVFSPDSRIIGNQNFYALFFVLCTYAIVIALIGYRDTSSEYLNRTFDLYILTGLSPQKMIFGKLFSMIGQFLFGFFCIVPFLFFSYFMGGLDFGRLIVYLVNLCIWVIPLYMISILFALIKSAWFKAILFFLGLFCFPTPFSLLIHFYIYAFRQILAGVGLFSFILNSILIIMIHSTICVILFYICCSMIDRSPKISYVHKIAETL